MTKTPLRQSDTKIWRKERVLSHGVLSQGCSVVASVLTWGDFVPISKPHPRLVSSSASVALMNSLLCDVRLTAAAWGGVVSR